MYHHGVIKHHCQTQQNKMPQHQTETIYIASEEIHSFIIHITIVIGTHIHILIINHIIIGTIKYIGIYTGMDIGVGIHIIIGIIMWYMNL